VGGLRYIDCTFLHPSCTFPTLEESLARLRVYVHRKQLDVDGTVHVVGDMLGHEAILIGLCRQLLTKMFVSPQCELRHRQLSLLDETRELLTGGRRGVWNLGGNGVEPADDAAEARVHVHGLDGFLAFARMDRVRRAESGMPPSIYLRACAMHFALHGIANPGAEVVECDEHLTRMLYSIHSGYEELRSFVRRLNVREVYPFNAPFVCVSCLSIPACTRMGMGAAPWASEQAGAEMLPPLSRQVHLPVPAAREDMRTRWAQHVQRLFADCLEGGACVLPN